MDIKEFYLQIRSLANNALGARFSFGQPSKLGDIYVIPVARVIYGLGGGGDLPSNETEKKEEEPTPEAEKTKKKTKVKVEFNGGGGIGIHSNPVGLFSIEDNRVKFHPVIGFREIMALLSVTTLFIFILKIKRIMK